MESLLVLCASLSFILGLFQLLFPNLIEKAEHYLDQMFNITKESSTKLRRFVGLLLILISLMLFYIIYNFNLDILI